MPGKTVTVLLIDDDAGYASVAKHLLSPFQNTTFNLLWDADGEQAAERLRNDHTIDLVLMDYYLPGKNGLEITKLLFEERLSVPIVFLTANKDFRIAVEAMKFGVEEYLVKEEAADTMLPRTVLNVLERIALRKRIKEAERQKLLTAKKAEAVQELVVTMCHEFNNPLAAIKISADILSRQSASDDDKKVLTRLNASIALLERQIIRLRDLNPEPKSDPVA
jgi:DNA-binding NarL/FixJ family response regulator